jgi:hypothetical protein
MLRLCYLPIDVPHDGVGWRLQFTLAVRTSAPRANSRPWRVNAILARAAGGLSSAIASRTALAAGGLSNAVAALTAAPAARVACGSGCAARSTCSTASATRAAPACATSASATPLCQRTGTECECRHK